MRRGYRLYLALICSQRVHMGERYHEHTKDRKILDQCSHFRRQTTKLWGINSQEPSPIFPIPPGTSY